MSQAPGRPTGQAEAWSSELPPPPTKEVVLTTRHMTAGHQLTPKQILFTYEDKEWEEFILEWAKALEDKYHHVTRFGGPGDRGVDVAGFASADSFEGVWDCFQCKHYSETIKPADLYPEIFKILLGVTKTEFKLPRRYVICAPRGCGPTLEKLLNAPTKLGERFIAELERPNGMSRNHDPSVVAAVRELAESTEFSIFASADMDRVIALHRGTPNHVLRFGGELPDRGAPEVPPSEIEAKENRYVSQLVEVYREKYKDPTLDAGRILSDSPVAPHFRRQRESFYSAESLRVFARDSVPLGTYEALQDEIHGGVIETAASEYPDGMARLTGVLNQATNIQVTANALIRRTSVADRKGICHQLANVDRLNWCTGESNEPVE